jgi:hypothetical protein
MNLSGLLSQVLQLTSSFNLQIALILFILCAVGEIGFGLPYLLEMMWLLAGYHLGMGELQPADLLYLWLTAQAGRQVGSLVLFYSSMLGMIPLKRFYKRYVEKRLPKRHFVSNKMLERLTNPSVFSVAIGRLIGLRIPMAMASSARNRIANQVLGVLLSSIVWDGLYMVIGATVGTKAPRPQYMLLYSVSGLTALYLFTLGIRYLFRLRSRSKQEIAVKVNPPG